MTFWVEDPSLLCSRGDVDDCCRIGLLVGRSPSFFIGQRFVQIFFFVCDVEVYKSVPCLFAKVLSGGMRWGESLVCVHFRYSSVGYNCLNLHEMLAASAERFFL
jgi:hypothetical protein